MAHHAQRPCGCSNHRPTTLSGAPGHRGAASHLSRTVLVIDAGGNRARVPAHVAADLAAADPGARVRRAHRDGTLGAAGEDVVMLSGFFSSIIGGIGSAAKGVFDAGKKVVGTVAPIVGAGVGFVVGGPAGVAVGAQIGSVVKSTVSPSQQQQVERKAQQIAERFAMAGVQISAEQAVALAQMKDADVERQLRLAQQQQRATATAGVTGQIYGSPVPQVLPQQAVPPPSSPPPTNAIGGIPMPLLLGGAALAAVVLLKK